MTLPSVERSIFGKSITINPGERLRDTRTDKIATFEEWVKIATPISDQMSKQHPISRNIIKEFVRAGILVRL